MRDVSIARNYADALLSLARKANDLPGWGQMIADVADAVERDERLRHFLESPRVGAAQKNAILRKAFADRMPRLFVRFLEALVSHGRQLLIPEIASEYRNLVDEAEGRVHARVTVARQPSADDERLVATQLSRTFGKQVVPHFSVNPAILGGLVVRVGDTVIDGSVRRRLALLRQRLVAR